MLLFNPNNPLGFLIAGIGIYFAVRWNYKKIADKHPGNIASFAAIIAVFVGIYLMANIQLLQAISFSIPLLVIVFILFCIVILTFFVLGVPASKIQFILDHKSTKFYTKIVVILILSLSASMVWGQDLLADKSVEGNVAFTDPLFKEDSKLNLAPVFDTRFLSGALVISILGMLLYFTNKS